MKYFNDMFREKLFLQKTVAIMVPIALQNLLNNLLNMIDMIMIGKLGETAVAAVGLANKVFFVFGLLMFGICSGSAVLSSQYWGKREIVNIKRVLRLSLIMAIGAAIIFTIPAIFVPKQVMRIFTPGKQTIAMGAVYLGIIAFSYPLTAISNVLVSILRSMNYVVYPVVITSLAIAVNIVLNYGLIFGKFGLPAMGVAGAALATLIARGVEAISLLILVYSHKKGDKGIGDLIHYKYNKVAENGMDFFHKAFLSKFFKTASPVILNEFMWGLGVTVYSMVYGRMGDASTAAITITGSIEQVTTVFFFGMATAAAVILGNELGADHLDKAEEYAKYYIVIQFCFTILGAILIIACKETMITMFDVSTLVADYIRKCTIVFSLYLPAKMLNALFIIAILRSGGDTKASLFLDVTGVWFIGIPMALLGGFVFHFPIYIVYAMVLLEEVYKLILGFMRYRQKKWVKNIVSS